LLGYLVTLGRASARRRRNSAGTDLLQLPEGTYEARAKAGDKKEQQEGLIDGWDLHHDNH
jgi:hypothetical protein